GDTGQIKTFYITHNGVTYTSLDTPVPIYDNQESYAYIPSLNIDDIMENAKFIYKLQTYANIDLNSILTNQYIPNATKIGEYIVWEKQLDDYITNPNNNGIAGYPQNTITLKFAINSNGDFYVGSFGGTDEDHLFLFVEAGVNNYLDFDGNFLSQTLYNVPKERMLDLNIRNNFLGYIINETYKILYKNGSILSGPSNYFELYNCPVILNNNTGKKVIVIDSYIYHNQQDYGYFNQLYKPIVDARNIKWSPIANNIDQDAELFRSFNIYYNSAQGSYLKEFTYTDNRNWGQVSINDIINAPNYSSNGYNIFDNYWQISYNNNIYIVYNENCSSSTVFLKSQYPSYIYMNDFTRWSDVFQAFSIAIFGNDITFSNLLEGPSNDDNNPQPNKLIINPGINNTEPCTPPSTPSLISPSNGEQNVSITPTFSWNPSSGTTPINYTLQISTNSSFSSYVFNQNIGTSTSYTLSSGILNYSTTYYWRVKATNSYGESTSDIYSFKTIASSDFSISSS
ncbi:MAG: fibronectin type III domain-containing protein, partial [Minisyncoccia bacterium]